MRQAIASVDPALPILSVRTLKEQVAGTFAQQRLIARLASFFGVLSLVLASIGLYGVTAHNAGRRTGEIGVRIALGATRGQVVAPGPARRARVDCCWTAHRAAPDVGGGTVPGQSAVRHEPIRSRRDPDSGVRARNLGARGMRGPGSSSEHNLACGRTANTITPLPLRAFAIAALTACINPDWWHVWGATRSEWVASTASLRTYLVSHIFASLQLLRL